MQARRAKFIVEGSISEPSDYERAAAPRRFKAGDVWSVC